jgi:hypothetical protein
MAILRLSGGRSRCGSGEGALIWTKSFAFHRPLNPPYAARIIPRFPKAGDSGFCYEELNCDAHN